MSKILRRPMFRGGPVDSRGTGITSGLMDGGRVGLKVSFPGTVGQAQEFLTGGDIMDLSKTKFSAGMPFPYQTTPLENIKLTDTSVEKEETPSGDVLSKMTDYLDIDESSPFEGVDNFEDLPKSVQNISSKTDFDRYKKEQSDVQDKNKELIASLQDLSGNDLPPSLRNPNKDNTDNQSTLDSLLNNNNEESTEMSVDDIKAQAQIFKDILNEGNDKKLRSARIADASEYALKFFEGSQKEGATVGSSAADVAGFATSKDSKTEKAKAGIDKTDQTATVMAINDYISGKKSKAEIEKLMGLAKYKDKLLGQRSKKNVGEYIMASNQVGFSGKVKEGVQAKYGPKSFEEILSTDLENFKFGDSDIGKIFIETDTQKVYTFDEKGNTIPIYQG